MSKLKFVKMTTTLVTYGVGKTIEDAKQQARSETIDYANDISINPKQYLDAAKPSYEEVREEDTSLDKTYIEFIEETELFEEEE
jgi:hypothetical protein